MQSLFTNFPTTPSLPKTAPPELPCDGDSSTVTTTENRKRPPETKTTPGRQFSVAISITGDTFIVWGRTLACTSLPRTKANLMEGSVNERLDFGKTEYGCKHYRRRCRIRAPCCNEIYSCRHCHNEEASLSKNSFDRHELVRQDVKQVVCSVCDTEQSVAQVCTNCGVKMGEYFCNICKFFDDDAEKQQFHCDDCGICRVGGRENFFHCKKCGSCYAVGLRDNHLCVENSMRHHCPICYEYLFDSLKDTVVMKCGHTMHQECYHEMIERDRYCCPICSKSVVDMSSVWKRIDEEIEASIMPEDYRYRKVWILCNDCNDTTEVNFHILGHKCGHCNSYNTRSIAPPVLPQ